MAHRNHVSQKPDPGAEVMRASSAHGMPGAAMAGGQGAAVGMSRAAMGATGHGMGEELGGVAAGTVMHSGSGSAAMAGSGGGDRPSGGSGSGGSGGSGSGAGGNGLPTRRSCATMDVHRRLLSESGDYRLARDRIENHMTAFAARQQERSGIAHIPVVVHVVYADASQNISDAQVQSQIDVLNRDYRATNPDRSTVPAPFQGLIADSQIEFFLATTDPSGNPTNGVTRTPTAVTSFSDDNKVKSSATGGADPWPAASYLNIWVCPLGGGLLGYAQFPGGPAETDGVVILHSGFGTTSTAAAPFNLGRTATHEIGHFFNLFHIWGDDGTGCSGSDQCDDTPNQGGPNFGVPAFPHVSCSNGPDGDLYMDYMDYVDDAAMVMFTAGQKARMDATLDGPRSSLMAQQRVPVPAGRIVSWGADRIDAFVLGTDHAMYHKWWGGSGWGPSVSDYEYMGGVCTSPPEVSTWGADRLDAFVLGTDRALYHKWWDGSGWGPSVTDYEYMGGICTSPPRLASWSPDRLDAFVLGTDRALYHKWWDGSAWGPSVTDFEYLGGICMSPPSVVSWGSNRLDVFVLGTDNAVFHKWWDGSAWGPSATDYESLGGICGSPPTAVAWGANRLDLFVLGLDHALYHKWWDGSAWGPSVDGWEFMGGICTSKPVVASWGENRLDVFVTGTDSALYHKWWDGSAWGPSVTGWESLGGVCVGEPRVTSWAQNRLDVFVVGTDSALYHKWWDGSAWGPSVDGYESLGGIVSDARIVLPAGAGAAQPAPRQNMDPAQLAGATH